jgi:hypothetical protein
MTFLSHYAHEERHLSHACRPFAGRIEGETMRAQCKLWTSASHSSAACWSV